MMDTRDIVPIPAITPVVTRNIFVLSRLQYACVNPSKYVGNMQAIVHQIFKETMPNRNNGKDR